MTDASRYENRYSTILEMNPALKAQIDKLGAGFTLAEVEKIRLLNADTEIYEVVYQHPKSNISIVQIWLVDTLSPVMYLKKSKRTDSEETLDIIKRNNRLEYASLKNMVLYTNHDIERNIKAWASMNRATYSDTIGCINMVQRLTDKVGLTEVDSCTADDIELLAEYPEDCIKVRGILSKVNAQQLVIKTHIAKDEAGNTTISVRAILYRYSDTAVPLLFTPFITISASSCDMARADRLIETAIARLSLLTRLPDSILRRVAPSAISVADSIFELCRLNKEEAVVSISAGNIVICCTSSDNTYVVETHCEFDGYHVRLFAHIRKVNETTTAILDSMILNPDITIACTGDSDIITERFEAWIKQNKLEKQLKESRYGNQEILNEGT